MPTATAAKPTSAIDRLNEFEQRHSAKTAAMLPEIDKIITDVAKGSALPSDLNETLKVAELDLAWFRSRLEIKIERLRLRAIADDKASRNDTAEKTLQRLVKLRADRDVRLKNIQEKLDQEIRVAESESQSARQLASESDAARNQLLRSSEHWSELESVSKELGFVKSEVDRLKRESYFADEDHKKWGEILERMQQRFTTREDYRRAQRQRSIAERKAIDASDELTVLEPKRAELQARFDELTELAMTP